MRKIGLIFLLLNWVNPAWAAVTDIANVPIEESAVVEPNIIFGADDSGSMDWEVLFSGTMNSELFWDIATQQFATSGTQYLHGDYSGTYAVYGYLFPNGTSSDARQYSDNDGHYALPPTPQFAFARSYQYNPAYYNPYYNYQPWAPAYFSGSTTTFTNASTTAARSHPIFPTSGSPTTTNVGVSNFSEASNYTFRMYGGMVIPGATLSGIYYQSASGFGFGFGFGGGSWTPVTTNLTIPSNSTYDVAIPYVPATYYVIDSTCTSGPTCATAPDGQKLRQYVIQAGKTFPSGRTYAAELQNFANWFTYYRKRRLLLGGAMGAVLPTLQGVRAGVINFNNNTTNTVTMYDFNSTTPSSNQQALLGMLYQNLASGGTPTRINLLAIGNQFETNHSVVQYACQLNSAFILTDGYANDSGVTTPPYNSATYGSGPPYQTIYANSIADIALSYYTTNIRPDLATGLVTNGGNPSQPNYDANPNLHMNTYALTLGVTGTIFGTGSPAALNPFVNYPNWPVPIYDYDPTAIDDLWHGTINGRGTMFTTGNIADLVTEISSIFSTVLIQSGAGSAVGLVQTYVTSTNNLALLTSYIGTTGNIQEVPINTTTGALLTSSVTWSAQGLLDALAPTSRIIATYSGVVGTAFEWGSIGSAKQTLLNLTSTSNDGQLVLNWLRGDRTNEGTLYRTRSHVLGDIVYSAPVVVNGATASYADTGYAAFSNSVALRTPMVYVGANDGMLHAFNMATGSEAWAYVPNAIFSKLNQLPNMNYTHQFYVDGTPVSGDVYVNSAWETILVGGLRAGGRGYYAMNITNPASVTNETSLASNVLWEFPNSATPTATVNNLGLSFGKPVIVKTAAAGWVVLVTSGYNNTSGDGKGHLFVLNPANGAVIADLNTGQGSPTSPAGLAQIAAYAANAQNSVLATQVYGGDLLGNVWRFDLSATTVSGWTVTLLASLVDSTGKAQPITTEPDIGVYNNQRFIFVGTGQLLGLSDISNTNPQTMYALVDNLSTNPTISPLRSNLAQRTVSGTTITGAAYNSQTNQGWYIDLPGVGERVNVNPVLAFGTLLFNTNMPSATACGSESFQYAVALNTGLPLPSAEFPSGTTPWARRVIGNTLVSSPSVIVLSNGQVVSLSHESNNAVDNTPVPSSGSTGVSKVAWKEILTQ